MRQAGIIAAPGIIAITKMIDRLKEDHENAAMLAKALREIKGIKLPYPVQTNMVFFDMGGLGMTPAQFTDEMKKCNIICSPRKGSTFRFVTYRGIDKEQIKYVIECLNKVTNK
jgi:threonine aldolase